MKRIFQLAAFLTIFSVFAMPLFPAQAETAAAEDIHIDEAHVKTWLSELRAEAIERGISTQIFDRAFAQFKPIKRVIELDRKQPEGKWSFEQYLSNVVNEARVAQGRRMYKQHRATLDAVARHYGVAPQYIVALWGIETSYGNITGGFDVIPALATLAWEGRRASFFRKELLEALTIVDEGHIALPHMKGSWAGAMGQNQFMPSSFQAYAVDGNGDGRKDIWTSLPDVFASSANYLSRHGWKDGERWGRAVAVPANFPESLTGLETTKPLSEWKRLGVTLPNGAPIPVAKGFEASLIAPDGLGGRKYLVYNNFRTVLKWNRSTYFATAVGLLADRISQ